jgi:hypothetical protein
MRLFKTLLIAAIAVGLSAASATALTSVSHENGPGGDLFPGDIFTIDVIAANDGLSVLTALGTSAGWDPTQLTFVSATSAPFNIFFGAFGSLARVADAGGVFPGDDAGTVRTIQFGANPGQQGGSFGSPQLITTLTFQVTTGAVPNPAEPIDVVFNAGDGCGGVAIPAAACTDFTTSGITVSIIPEPGTALLMGLGLAGLGYVGRRR